MEQDLEIITIQKYKLPETEKFDRNKSYPRYEIITQRLYANGDKSGTLTSYQYSEDGLYHSFALTLKTTAIKAKIEYGRGFEKDTIYSYQETFDVMLNHHNSFIELVKELKEENKKLENRL